MTDAITEIVGLGILGAISEDELRRIDPSPTMVTVDVGETIIRRGETGDAYYLLLRGRLRRFVEDASGRVRPISDIKPGDGVGASSILTGEVYDTTVRATHQSDLIRFSRASFLQLMVLSWEFSIGVTRAQVKRARASTSPVTRPARSRSIAVVSLSRSIDAENFVRTLGESLAHRMPTGICTAREISDEGEEWDVDRIASRFDSLERQNGVALYPTAINEENWARLVLGRVDLILLLAAHDDAPEPRAFEVESAASVPTELRPRTHLALFHGTDWSMAPGCVAWLAGRSIDEWHHLRHDSKDDLDRLARTLSGEAVSLVLGGGGARSFAQIGVVKAIREAGIPIDRVAGTSMGAIIGGYIALGFDEKAIVDDISGRWSETRAGRDYTFPALSLLHCKGLHDAAIGVFGDRRIEDLPLPFLCISTDFTDNALIVHDQGVMWKAIRASASLPGISPPMFENGHILVDGGLLNNLPCDIVAERYIGKIMAVNVSHPGRMDVPTDFEEVPSGWEILLRKVNPFARSVPVPNIFTLLTRSATIASIKSDETSRQLANLLFVPPVENVGITQFDKLEEMVETGYRHAVEVLDAVDPAVIFRDG